MAVAGVEAAGASLAAKAVVTPNKVTTSVVAWSKADWFIGLDSLA